MKIQRSIHIDMDLYSDAKTYCKEHSLLFSHFVSTAIKNYIQQLKSEDHYAALELEHLGDPVRKTGIYAEKREQAEP